MEQHQFNRAIANGGRVMSEKANAEDEIRRLKRDISDLRDFLGPVSRGPCGRLRLDGFICPCGEDHSIG